jgi:hypothetical protein
MKATVLRRHAGKVHLIGRRGDHAGRAAGEIDADKLRHPPVVVPVPLCGGGDEAPAVRRPVVFVDPRIGGGDEAKGAAGCGDHGDALLVLVCADLAGQRLAGLRRAHLLVRADDG